MVVEFKYNMGQRVFYQEEQWEIVSQCFLRTRLNDIKYYNLKNIADPKVFESTVWEHELKPFGIIK